LLSESKLTKTASKRRWFQEKDGSSQFKPVENIISIAFRRLRHTISTVKDYREFVKHIIAFLIYNDGILMAINFAAIFGAVMFGLDQQ